MGGRVIVLPILEELEEFLGPPLLEETHQRTLDGLHFGTGNFGYPPITIDKAACDLLELEIPDHIRVHKNLGHLARCNDELGDQIDGIVTVTAQRSRRCLVWPELPP